MIIINSEDRSRAERNFLLNYLRSRGCQYCPCDELKCGDIAATCFESVRKWMTNKMEEDKKNERCD